MKTTTQKQQDGYDFAKGIGQYLSRWIFTALIILGLFAFIRNQFGRGLDDSDKDGWNRSGLRIHTDAKTGIQYLATKDGALTPRLDATGNPLKPP